MPGKTPAKSGPGGLSEREMSLLAIAIGECLQNPDGLKIDSKIFAERGNFKNTNTAVTVWGGIKKKLMCCRTTSNDTAIPKPPSRVNESTGTNAEVNGTSGDDNEATTTTTPKKRGGGRKRKADGEAGADSEAAPKKPRGRKPKSPKPMNDDEAKKTWGVFNAGNEADDDGAETEEEVIKTEIETKETVEDGDQEGQAAAQAA